MVAIGIAPIVKRPQVGIRGEIRIEREDAPCVRGRGRIVIQHSEGGGKGDGGLAERVVKML
jgi:hypothetical protein